MHVFGDPQRFPPAPGPRSYGPTVAPLAHWRRALAGPGFERAVVVQASVYGADNSCLLEAMAELGPRNARGVAGIDATTPPSVLRELHEAGVRGVRLNPRSAGGGDVATVGEEIRRTAAQVEPLGWHVELHAGLDLLNGVFETLRDCPVPLVLDHLAGADVADGTAVVDRLRPVLELLDRGRTWVKVSGAYRVTGPGEPVSAVLPLLRRFLSENPERLTWGSDWPHTAAHGPASGTVEPIAFRRVDEHEQLGLLATACPDQATFTRVLQENPATLYGF